MAKVGDKFIIEIGEVFTAKGTYTAYGCEENEYEENLYRVKGFNSLVFDDEGLSKLEKYDPTHVAGPTDGHDLPSSIYGMSTKDNQIYIGRVVWQRP
jgi:hypothetical protein